MICRRVREAGVYCELRSCLLKLEDLMGADMAIIHSTLITRLSTRSMITKPKLMTTAMMMIVGRISTPIRILEPQHQ